MAHLTAATSWAPGPWPISQSMRLAHERLQDRALGGTVRVQPLVTCHGRLGGPAAALTGGYAAQAMTGPGHSPRRAHSHTAGLTRPEPGAR